MLRGGILDIYQVWENEGWPMPVVEESYNPDRTRLTLEFKKQANKTSVILKEMPGLVYEGTTNNRKYRLVDEN